MTSGRQNIKPMKNGINLYISVKFKVSFIEVVFFH